MGSRSATGWIASHWTEAITAPPVEACFHGRWSIVGWVTLPLVAAAGVAISFVWLVGEVFCGWASRGENPVRRSAGADCGNQSCRWASLGQIGDSAGGAHGLGQRADSGMVRHGATRAELHAEFDLAASDDARQWLQEEEFDDGDACQLRRTLRADGGSRAWINGRQATLSQLAALAGRLVEIHGQHEHQALLSRPSQLALLDAFGGHARLLAAVSGACALTPYSPTDLGGILAFALVDSEKRMGEATGCLWESVYVTGLEGTWNSMVADIESGRPPRLWERGGAFLFAGRLVPYKLPGLAIECFAQSPALREHRLLQNALDVVQRRLAVHFQRCDALQTLTQLENTPAVIPTLRARRRRGHRAVASGT